MLIGITAVEEKYQKDNLTVGSKEGYLDSSVVVRGSGVNRRSVSEERTRFHFFLGWHGRFTISVYACKWRGHLSHSLNDRFRKLRIILTFLAFHGTQAMRVEIQPSFCISNVTRSRELVGTGDHLQQGTEEPRKEMDMFLEDNLNFICTKIPFAWCPPLLGRRSWCVFLQSTFQKDLVKVTELLPVAFSDGFHGTTGSFQCQKFSKSRNRIDDSPWDAGIIEQLVSIRYTSVNAMIKASLSSDLYVVSGITVPRTSSIKRFHKPLWWLAHLKLECHWTPSFSVLPLNPSRFIFWFNVDILWWHQKLSSH